MMERIIQKIGRIYEYLKIVDGLKHGCTERFDNDAIFRGALLHYLYLLSDTCIVLAEMVIRERNLRPPQSYAESFDILGEAEVINAEFAFSFARIAGFRNFLAHDYETVDAAVICGKVLDSIGDIREYVRQIKISCDL